jgi:hypothetical protein
MARAPLSCCPRQLALHQRHGRGMAGSPSRISVVGGDISVITPGDPKRPPEPFVHSPAAELYPAFSIDGRWLAYASNKVGAVGSVRGAVSQKRESGTRFRSTAARNRCGRTTAASFFTVPDPGANTDFNTVMVVDVATSPTFKAGTPRPLGAKVRLSVPMRGYDVRADDQRFLTLRDTKAAYLPPPSQMIVVINWVEELKRRVPTK